MFIDLPFLESRFNRFNKEIFRGELSQIPFFLNKNRSRAAYIKCRATHSFRGPRYTDFQFHASTVHNLPESVMEDVIIHEMIHYYILSKGLTDKTAHGPVFRAIMNDINKRYGRNITISLKRTPGGEATPRVNTNGIEVIAVARMADGRSGYLKCARSRVHDIDRVFSLAPEIREHRWYLAPAQCVSRLPRARTAKVYYIDNQQLQDILDQSQPVVIKRH